MTVLLPSAAAGGVLLAAGFVAQITPIGSLIGTIAGMVGTYLALRANAKTARTDYQGEMADAKAEGAREAVERLQPIIDALREQSRRDEQARRDEVAAINEQRRRDETARRDELARLTSDLAYYRDLATRGGGQQQ